MSFKNLWLGLLNGTSLRLFLMQQTMIYCLSSHINHSIRLDLLVSKRSRVIYQL